MIFGVRGPLLVLSSVALALAVTGCGIGTGTKAISSNSSPVLTGKVFGGQQPVTGAAISLYKAGSGGPGVGASALLNSPVVSDGNGAFSITSDYTCPTSATQVYLVARGGNPGLGVGTNNAALVMMAALGDCGNLSPSSFININEVTTVAAAWSLQQFLAPGANVGATSTNATGLRNAFLVANNLVNTATGVAYGAAIPSGATLEAAKLYTLADVLSSCVNSDGTAACTPLFTAATVDGNAPTDTLDAALNIVRHPGSQVSAVYDAISAQPPFQPTLKRAPNDWTMTLTYTGGGLDQPTALAVDSTGSVWTADYSGIMGKPGTATKLSVTGVPSSSNGFTDASLYESYGITVDGSDDAWITNQESAGANSGNGTITKISSTGQILSGSGFFAGGIYFPNAVAADSNGDIWVADYGRSKATLLSASGVSLSGASGYTPANLPFPSAVALDANHNAWFAGQSVAVKITPSGTATTYKCGSEPSGIAVDQVGNVWVTDYLASALVELSSSGTTLQTLKSVGGVRYPESLAIDGVGNVWLTDYHGASKASDTISGFTGASGGATSTAISPSTGFGVDAGLKEPFGIAIDASGNLWVANFGGASLTQFVGLASPIKTPLLGPPAQP